MDSGEFEGLRTGGKMTDEALQRWRESMPDKYAVYNREFTFLGVVSGRTFDEALVRGRALGEQYGWNYITLKKKQLR